MRTTIDIPDDLLAQALEASGSKTKREAIRWALQEALRQHAIRDLLSRKVKIDFALGAEDLEAREIRDEYGQSRRRRPG